MSPGCAYRASADPSQKKSDLYATNMAEDGLPTIVDVGVAKPGPKGRSKAGRWRVGKVGS
eukprot:COSAG04_NODE_13532_length_602_cov_0.779324_2_plen_60_part_00